MDNILHLGILHFSFYVECHATCLAVLYRFI